MDYNSRLQLSYYNDIGVLNEAHKIYICQHIETKKIYIKKILSVYNLSIYQQLKDNPVPGIPTIHCLYEADNELTIIEDYIQGSTLAELLSTNGALSEEQTRHYALELCKIVKRLHSFMPPIIHRDIKPSNIIVTPSGALYLIDLNAAKKTSDKDEDTMLLGTKGYAAPEQYGFGSSDIKTDIYSIGMVINTLLIGEYSQKPCEFSQLKPIIYKCTRMNPDERYHSIDDLYEALSHDGLYRKHKPAEYLPPGFRTKTPWHMIVAIPFYVLFTTVLLTFDVKDTYGVQLWFERISCLIIYYVSIMCLTNYLDVWRFFPLCKSKYLILRIIGVISITLCVAFTLFIFVVFTIFCFRQ